MDLTRFMHGGPARLLSCGECGLIFRDEQLDANYENDRYDSELMKHLYPRFVKAFEEKRAQYLPFLRPRSEILEVGSHLGGFLQVAEEWGWRPTGLDIGWSTSNFARKQGSVVRRLTLDDYAPNSVRPDAIFIWNCFEQLDDPESTLRRAHQLLNRHGLLVLRVPDVDFYRKERRKVERSHAGQAVPSLGYNNLLAFPYLHGFSAKTLDPLLRRFGFEPVAKHNSAVLSTPYPEMSRRVREEWKAVRATVDPSPAKDAPWLEIVSRRVEAEGR